MTPTPLIQVPVVPASGGAGSWNRFLGLLGRWFEGHSPDSVGKKVVKAGDALLGRPIAEVAHLNVQTLAALESLKRERAQQPLDEALKRAQIAQTEASAAELESKTLLNIAEAFKRFQEAGFKVEPQFVGGRFSLRIRGATSDLQEAPLPPQLPDDSDEG